MVTADELKTLRQITSEIDELVTAYYERHIKCNHTYSLLGWHMGVKDEEIEIRYGFTDHYDERCYDETIISIEDLNEDYE